MHRFAQAPKPRNTTLWYVFEMSAGWRRRYGRSYEVNEKGSEAARYGEIVAGPFGGPLGFSRAYEEALERTKKNNDS